LGWDRKVFPIPLVLAMIDAIFGDTVRVLEKSMSLRMMRQGLLASNIANVETPNYRALDIDFQATMAKLLEKTEKTQTFSPLELQQTDPRHFDPQGVSGAEKERTREHIVFQASDSPAIGNDNNSVSLETELAKSQQNSLLYSVTTQLLAKKLKGLTGIVDSVSRF
jgi:flagellar basal-body rod protein FlgB